ncbi:MAG: hypothetical protein ACOCZU_01955 [Planctomycetota bacterium]
MRIELLIRIGLGACVGAMAGFALSRAKTCSAEACRAGAVTWYAILAGAVFGGVAAYVWSTSG